MEIWTAFLIGLFGSLHCAGMCGPIVLGLPSASESGSEFTMRKLIYNFGRIASYGIIGLVMGLFGRGLSLWTSQQYLSIALGIIILLRIFLPGRIFPDDLFLGQLSFKLKGQFGKLLRSQSRLSNLGMGVLNGFLPCGLVYAALAGAISTGEAFKGMLFMIIFGLGTFPLMLVISLFGGVININIKRKFNRLIPFFAALLALVFILRGLNLGIPMISPKMHIKAAVMKADCCK